MSTQTRCLLDKVTARRILEGLLKLAEARALSAEEAMALVLYDAARADGTPAMRHFVVPPTERVLQRLEEHARYAALIQLFRQRVEVVFPTRYFKRWARRLQRYGFTPEDARVLALATFGTDTDSTILSMHVVVTFDQPMVTQWIGQHAAIQEHLVAMQHGLPLSYRQALLPQVLHAREVISNANFFPSR